MSPSSSSRLHTSLESREIPVWVSAAISTSHAARDSWCSIFGTVELFIRRLLRLDRIYSRVPALWFNVDLLLTPPVVDLCYDVRDKMAPNAQLVTTIDSIAIDFWLILPTGLERRRSGILIIDNRVVFCSCRWQCGRVGRNIERSRLS